MAYAFCLVVLTFAMSFCHEWHHDDAFEYHPVSRKLVAPNVR